MRKILDLTEEEFHRDRVEGILKRRELEPVLDQEWKLFKPSSEYDMVWAYVGYAERGNGEEICVTLTPEYTCELEHEWQWWNPDLDNKIPVKTR